MFIIDIPRRSPQCAKKGEKFEQGMDYYSALFETEKKHQFARQDFCVACWECFSSQPPPFIRTYWKSKIPLKEEANPIPKQREERALYLIKEALNLNTKESREEAFILALYLVRKKMLHFRHELPEEILLYEVSKTEETLCIPKISLSELPIENIQMALARKFKECNNT